MGRGFAIAVVILVAGCERLRVNIPVECANGACDITCDDGQTQCGGDCVNLAVDPRHCGGCGNECPAENYCVAGVCAFGCSAPNGVCPSPQGYEECIDVASNINDCGGCGEDDPSHVCTATTGQGTTAVCNSGACGWSCQAGLFACGDTPVGTGGEPTCTPRDADNCHCGGCDTSCRSWAFDSTASTCESSGPVGEVCCGGGCVPLDQDESCGVSCAMFTNCTRNPAAKSCCPISATGFGCVDEKRDETNCGGCGVTCAAVGNSTCCDSGCVDIVNDIQNCGDCGIACSGTTPACCPGGGANNRSCQDLWDDRFNCGNCGNVCICTLGLPTCNMGECACIGI